MDEQKPTKFIKLVKPSSRKKYIDKHLQQIANTPEYKDIMEKYESSQAHTVNTNVNMDSPSAISDDVTIFTQAEQIMESLENGELTLGMLDLYQKSKLLYYLERYNKRVGRIIDILTRIPISSISLQKPKTQYTIVNDYVFKIFNEMFQSEGFLSMLEKVVRHYWLFSFASVLIEDDYAYIKESNILDDIDVRRSLKSIIKDIDTSKKHTISEAELKKLDKKYIDAPSEVTAEDRKRFLAQVLSVHSPKYKGVFKFTVLPVSATIERFENNDVNYYTYNIPLSDNLKKTVENIQQSFDITDANSYRELLAQMKAVGYSEAMLNAMLDAKDPSTVLGSAVSASGNDAFPVDNDPYNNLGCYVVTLQRQGLAQKDNSIFNRVFMDAVDLVVAQRRLREKVNRGFKKDILVTVGEKEDEANIAQLQALLDQAASSDEGTFIVTNMDVNTSDLDLNANSNLDLEEIIEQGNQNISEGVGISESLITDSTDAYSNTFLKTTILENEMTQFRTALVSFLEKQIFEPIAIKMGFIMRDEWGDAMPVYPRIKFGRLTLARGSDDLEFLSEMSQNGQMPQSVILEALGFDADEIAVRLRDENLTLMNTNLKEKFSEVIGEKAAEALAQNDRIVKRLAENLDIDYNALKKALESSGEESGGGFGRR